jgi:hypothetical protein
VRGGELAGSTFCRAWRKARVRAPTAPEAASPLAGRPYDLQHAAVSTWLNAGAPSTQVAEWAGHSLAVLLAGGSTPVLGGSDAGNFPHTQRSDLAKPVAGRTRPNGHDQRRTSSRVH